MGLGRVLQPNTPMGPATDQTLLSTLYASASRLRKCAAFSQFDASCSCPVNGYLLHSKMNMCQTHVGTQQEFTWRSEMFSKARWHSWC